MTDILGKLGGLADLGTDALLAGMATLIDGLGKGTEWTGEQIEKLGELEQQLAGVARMARDAYEPGG
jgi:hypothetical protein